MKVPAIINFRHGLVIGEQDDLLALQQNDVTYFSEDHIRETAKSIGMDGDAFIAQLNGVSYAEWLKGGNNDR